MDKLVQSLGITTLSKSQVSRDGRGARRPGRGVPHPPPGGCRAVHVRRRRRPGAEGPRGRPGRGRPCAGRDRGQRRRAPGDPRRKGRHQPRTAPAGSGSSPTSSPAAWRGVRLVTSDAHAGLVAAIAAKLAGAGWQRCRTHYAANLMSVTPKIVVGLGQSAAALDLRPARRRGGARPVRPRRRCPDREAPRTSPSTSRPPAPTSSPSPRSRKRSGARSGPTTPTNGSTARSAAAPTSSASSPTATRSSGSSAPSWPNNTTNGPKAAATSDSTSSPARRPSTSPPGR